MISTPEIVEQIIKKSPFLEEALLRDLINVSSLARQIYPEVQTILEQKTLRDSPIQLGAIIMALKRLKTKLPQSSKLKEVLKRINDISIKSNITEYTYKNSPTLTKLQSQLLGSVAQQASLTTFSHGVFETTLFVNSGLEELVEKLFTKETLIRKMYGLSSITLMLPVEAAEVPGVYYAILKQLAWEGISFQEIVSSFTEVTFYIESDRVEAAFSALKKIH
ncbi:hypothetical protein A2631_00505 [Candidatus Daviesbacteria bacterium RIFCSPHIGHO2_01_FULL_44_29]|uniref:ACT domain-containing protein n=1 Tax=Candidatus Daviesbacteria bacterium RIFCSPHIGHO2_02_FULL_43_12 TaxID=1797776 RepID=A0A1F5KHI5_9BACT|nr:MAG: hypothetical protein A2631_00505 [Candidatus Daviesbacteria bacterium RIFCSPHIGHO2_01_FULL_44_29]OGE40406.1 MAG: hypothetical protein A3D25_00070 [Candidatus Daviesbacteria bacterium RIFCSPHIGHO2_02_FULL_43_12]OGE69730.1 MAG: hypothetical protein A3B55_02050 [Candidatus Daviesbacteria bacterium RIFCSPLOWO2_01_FULL_43_15]